MPMPAIFSLSLGAMELADPPSTWLGTIRAAEAAAALPMNWRREIVDCRFIIGLDLCCKDLITGGSRGSGEKAMFNDGRYSRLRQRLTFLCQVSSLPMWSVALRQSTDTLLPLLRPVQSLLLNSNSIG